MFKTTQRLRKSTAWPRFRALSLAFGHRILFRKSIAACTILGSLSLSACYDPNSADAGDSGNSTGDKHQGDVSTEYSEVLAATTRFFGANRCGDGDNWTLTDNFYGSTCHENDGDDVDGRPDLSGGWHDAGDFIKFTLTNAWAAYALGIAYEVAPSVHADNDDAQYRGKANGIPDILDELRYGTNYLEKMFLDEEHFVSRIGNDGDHNLWVTSPYQTENADREDGGGVRPVYDNGKADVAALSAAALAVAARAFKPSNASLAKRYADAAIEQYRFAKEHPGTSESSFYQDGNAQDNLFCGAIELYRLTEEDDYLSDAKGYLEGLFPWAVDWSDATALCLYSLYLVEPEAASVWKDIVDEFKSKVTTAKYVNGLAHFGDWGSLRYSSGAAFAAGLFAISTGDEAAMEFAKGQVDYILGDNEYERSFIVGVGTQPPQHPHHKNAFGRDALDWDLSGTPVTELTGALVGGPTSEALENVTEAGYVDSIHDYVGNEVTIEYNALFVGALSVVAKGLDASSR